MTTSRNSPDRMDLPFVGLTTFARQPACPDWDKLDGADVAILGVPIDTASSYRVGTRFRDEAASACERFVRRAVRKKWQRRKNKTRPSASANRSGMINDLIDCDRGRVASSQTHDGKRVADECYIDPCKVSAACNRIIVCGQESDRLAARLLAPDDVRSNSPPGI